MYIHVNTLYTCTQILRPCVYSVYIQASDIVLAGWETLGPGTKAGGWGLWSQAEIIYGTQWPIHFALELGWVIVRWWAVLIINDNIITSLFGINYARDCSLECDFPQVAKTLPRTLPALRASIKTTTATLSITAPGTTSQEDTNHCYIGNRFVQNKHPPKFAHIIIIDCLGGFDFRAPLFNGLIEQFGGACILIGFLCHKLTCGVVARSTVVSGRTVRKENVTMCWATAFLEISDCVCVIKLANLERTRERVILPYFLWAQSQCINSEPINNNNYEDHLSGSWWVKLLSMLCLWIGR